MNREMLKEAIADAKTIQETAIESAKSALEEAFTPQLTAMFAERLNELELEEEKDKKEPKEEIDEMYSVEEEELEETFNLEELLAELSMEEEQEPTMEGDDMGEPLDEDLMLEEMSDEEIEELVMQVIDDMIASGKLMPGEGEEEDEEGEDMEDMEDMEVGDEDEEIDIDEILSEMEDKESITEAGVISQFIDFVTSGNMTAAGNVIDAALHQATAGDVAGGLGVTGSTVAFFKALKSYLKDRKTEKGDKMEETSDATEMEETIAELRNELNEVNLLNAKLLYTNKIFKSKNLTESEKIKVLNTFDKAETVKEVKLVFETLTESLKTITVKKNPIKESLGSASKTISTATPKQPIIESNDAFARMQRLAGLKK